MNKLAKKLIELRRENGLSQTELGKRLNRSQQCISKWENGYTLPDILDCLILVDFYEITLDELLDKE